MAFSFLPLATSLSFCMCVLGACVSLSETPPSVPDTMAAGPTEPAPPSPDEMAPETPEVTAVSPEDEGGDEGEDEAAVEPEATASDPAEPDSPGLATRTYRQTRAGINEAAMAPLKDMNLRRDPIPPLLVEIKNPYAVSVDTDCDAIAAEILELDALLGRDWDVPPPDKKKLSDQAADGASTAFLETVAAEASGLIPYRGVVRSLSGADRHRSKRRKAFERGSHRRTFLKGLGLAKACPYPASPQALPEPDAPAKIVFR